MPRWEKLHHATFNRSNGVWGAYYYIYFVRLLPQTDGVWRWLLDRGSNTNFGNSPVASPLDIYEYDYVIVF